MITECQVKNLKVFCMVLNCILRFVPGGKIVINNEGIQILTKTTISRIKMVSKCCISDEEIVLTFNDFKKIVILLESVLRNQKKNSIILKYNQNKHVLSYDSDELSFKISCVKEEIISQYIDTEIKAKLTPSVWFTIDLENLSEFLSNSTSLIETQTHKFKIFQDETKLKMVMIESISDGNSLSNYLKSAFGIIKTDISKLECLPIAVDSERLNMITQLQRFSVRDLAICTIYSNSIIEYSVEINYEDSNEINASMQIFTSAIKD